MMKIEDVKQQILWLYPRVKPSDLDGMREYFGRYLCKDNTLYWYDRGFLVRGRYAQSDATYEEIMRNIDSVGV